MYLKNTKMSYGNSELKVNTIGKVIHWLSSMAAAQSRLSPNSSTALFAFVVVELADGSVTLWATTDINTHVSVKEVKEAGFPFIEEP